jgi:hypothetical protein
LPKQNCKTRLNAPIIERSKPTRRKETNMITSLAQFKKLAVIGARFERVFAAGDSPRGKPATPAVRIVNYTQSNAVAFRVNPDNPSAENSNRSWFYFPKAKNARFENGKLVTLGLDGQPILTLEYLGGPQ